MALPTQRWISYADYLELEAAADTRHEWLDGRVSAMAGGTLDHAACVVNVIGAIGERVRGQPVRLYSSDARVRVPATGLATYPDLSVLCGPREVHPEDPQALTNPALLVEVSSPTTALYDRTEKLDHYRQIEALQEVLLVDHRAPRVEVWRREGPGWRVEVFGPGQAAPLAALGVALPVDALYEGVELSPDPPRGAALSRSSGGPA